MQGNSKTSSELEAFLTEAELKLQGKTYQIRPVAWKVEFKVLKEIAPLLIWGLELSGKESFDAIDFFRELQGEAFDEHIEQISKVLTMLTQIPQDEIDQLDIDELSQVIAAVIEVNKAFFMNAYNRLVRKKEEALEQAGKNKK